MKYLLLLTLISNNIFAQETPNNFLKKLCDYNSERFEYSEGLKMKLVIPCLWKKVVSDKDEQQTKFNYSDGTTTISEILNIKTLPSRPTKSDLDDFYSQKSLTQLGQSLGTFISARKSEINGFSCGEITFKTVTQFPSAKIYLYSLQYYFLYKNKMVIIGFSAGTPTDQNSKKEFTTYFNLFRDLAKKTIFLN